jgi:hypothetical protein
MSGWTLFFGIAAVAGVIIGIVPGILGNTALTALHRTRRKFQRVLRQRLPRSRVSTFGGGALYLGNPRHPDIWIRTATDEERDQLKREGNLPNQFRTMLVQFGYPAQDAPFVRFAFESQETVNREFGGSWSRWTYEWLRRHD